MIHGNDKLDEDKRENTKHLFTIEGVTKEHTTEHSTQDR